MNAVKWAIVCLAFTGSLFSQAPTNGLSVYLPLNGTSTDLSGTGKQITAQGMTFASGPNSAINQSAYFNGASSKIDFAPALNGTAEITVSFWAKNPGPTPSANRAPSQKSISKKNAVPPSTSPPRRAGPAEKLTKHGKPLFFARIRK
jgi:hypothetical protein